MSALMLSRPFTVPMPRNANATSWDIFCNVIDNYGDIGVCWRLARQLASEFNIAVHLWVDDLQAFKRICPEIDAHRAIQMVQGVEVRFWAGDVLVADPGDVVIEAFACQLPEQFVRAMATRQRPPG